MVAFVDLDGVIVDLVSEAFLVHGLPNPYVNAHSRGKWMMHELADMEPGPFWAKLKSVEFWTNLPFMPDAHRLLEMVKAKFGYKNIWLFTACTEDSSCTAGKHEWIKKRMPAFSKRFFIAGEDKHPFANDGTCLIDDRDENIDAFSLAGGNVVHVPRPWNRLHTFSTLDYVQDALRNLP